MNPYRRFRADLANSPIHDCDGYALDSRALRHRHLRCKTHDTGKLVYVRPGVSEQRPSSCKNPEKTLLISDINPGAVTEQYNE
jgi:hypothetical protein